MADLPSISRRAEFFWRPVLGPTERLQERPEVVVASPRIMGVSTDNATDPPQDCPLHGSVFAADGAVTEGPAVQSIASDEGVPSEEVGQG